MATFEGIEQTNRHNFTWIQVGVRALVDISKLIVYHVKQADDQFVRGHTVLLVMWLYSHILEDGYALRK